MYKSEQLKPYGTEGTKKEQVEAMFNNIASTYDTLNHTLSFGVDRLWRKKAIEWLKESTDSKNTNSSKHSRETSLSRSSINSSLSILDIATGTGDFAIQAHKMLRPKRIVGCDISEGMMDIGRAKVARLGLADKIEFRNEDCSAMSFADGEFDAVISAFALRNFQHLDQCFSEMHRVLAPGGRLSIVDPCTPVSFPMKQLYWLYSHTVMPVLGRFLSKDSNAYTYLPESMRAVPQGDAMRSIIANAGFRNARFRRLIFGMCILYTAEKEA